MNTALISTGRTLTYQVGDFDAEDTYRFIVRGTEGALALDYDMGEEGGGEVIIEKAALDAAKGVLNFSQGSYVGMRYDDAAKKRAYESVSSPCPSHSVPFLLPRIAFLALAKGEEASFQPLWDAPDVDSFAVTAKMKVMVPVDGEERAFDALEITGVESGAKLVVLDDAEWPLVVRWEECGGDNHWLLQAVARA